MAPVITLTTDFGWRDPYVAAMKGVILSRLADAVLHDLSHDLPPQDVFAGSLFLAGAVPWFPPDTFHVVVVDPGVGTTRAPLAARWRGQVLVLPDNGLLTFLHRMEPVTGLYRIEHPDCRLVTVSGTFHGRDVFAPAVAALAGGAPLESIGAPIEAPVLLPVPCPESRPGGSVAGTIMHIDRFGNAMSNIASVEGTFCEVLVAGLRLPVVSAYAEALPGEPLALVGSTGFVEVAVNLGRADSQLGLAVGSPLEAFHV